MCTVYTQVTPPPHTHTCRGFSSSEMLAMESKYYCEKCCSKQEATKRLRVKKLPQILALHLKRFKFMEQSQRFTKLSYRVTFPWELKLFNTVSVLPPASQWQYCILKCLLCVSQKSKSLQVCDNVLRIAVSIHLYPFIYVMICAMSAYYINSAPHPPPYSLMMLRTRTECMT